MSRPNRTRHEVTENGANSHITDDLRPKESANYEYYGTDQNDIMTDGLIVDDTLDTHSHTVAKAKYLLKKFLSKARSQGIDPVYVITGWGRHSPNGISRIKNMVLEYLDEHNIRYEWENQGKVIIYLNRSGCPSDRYSYRPNE